MMLERKKEEGVSDSWKPFSFMSISRGLFSHLSRAFRPDIWGRTYLGACLSLLEHLDAALVKKKKRRKVDVDVV